MSPLVLMTGATGWLGMGLVRALTHGLPDVPDLAEPPSEVSLRCLLMQDEALPDDAPASTEHVAGDLRDPASLDHFCRGAESAILFHLAGVIHPRLLTRDFTRVNVEGTRQLLAAAERHGVHRAVVMSSNSPLGTNPSRRDRFDETSPYRPYMGYGRSKMRMEQLVAAHRERGRMETVVVRAPWFYGPSQPARQTEFFRMIRRGRAPLVGDGGNLRSMAYIDNLCQGLIRCARHPGAAGETYWIADRRPYAMSEILDTVEHLMAEEFGLAVSGRRLRLPSRVSDLARVADASLQALGLYQAKLHVLSEMNQTIACTIEKARREIAYEPAIELEEGMRRSLRWCVEQGIDL